MRYSKPDPLPESTVLRTVNDHQCIAFEGTEYDVSALAVSVGDKVAVAHSKTFEGEVCAFVEDGAESYEVVLKKVIKDRFGFAVDGKALGTKEQPMDFETLREQARRWRANQEPGCERELGYVVIFNGQAVGWKRSLDNPQGWEPGCLAVAADGSVYEAVGGNDYDGARVWQRLDLPNPAFASVSAPISSPANTHESIRGGLGLSSVLTERAVPVSLAVTDQDRLLAIIEAGLADEMRGLISALNKLGRAAQNVSKELSSDTYIAKAVTLLFGACSFELSYFLAKSIDNFTLARDCTEYFRGLEFDIKQSFRELEFDGKRFLAVACADESDSSLFQ